MPAMVIVGLAKSIPTLYTGLALFSFGRFSRLPLESRFVPASRLASRSPEKRTIKPAFRASY